MKHNLRLKNIVNLLVNYSERGKYIKTKLHLLKNVVTCLK